MNKSTKSSGRRFKTLIDCSEGTVKQTPLIITLLHVITSNTTGPYTCEECLCRQLDMWMHMHAHRHTRTHRNTITVSCCLRKRGAVWCHSNQCGYPTLLEQERKKKEVAMTDWQDPNEMLDKEMKWEWDYLFIYLCIYLSVYLSV